MVSYKDFADYHKQIGLWNTPENFNRYGYVLSPEKFILTKDMQEQLHEIGQAVSSYQRGASILAQKLQQKKGLTHTESMIYRLFKDALSGLPFVVSDRINPLCKVDLMIDSSGKFKIAEIDAYNPRAIAYAIFLREMNLKLNNTPQDALLPGVFNTLSKFWNSELEPTWVHAHRERYYEPILRHMNTIITNDYGYPMNTVSALNSNQVKSSSKFFMLPWGMQQKEEQETKRFLLEKYLQNENDFFCPLTPWMGTKGILGLVSSPYSNELKKIVNENFTDLTLLSKYLPETLLVHKEVGASVKNFTDKHPCHVLKANIASGMKGVWMKEDEIEVHLKEALTQRSPIHTLQECIDQKKFSFQAYNSKGEIFMDEWYVRMIIHVDTEGNVVDAEVTGRTEPDVHGAPDCIMFPCVLG